MLPFPLSWSLLLSSPALSPFAALSSCCCLPRCYLSRCCLPRCSLHLHWNWHPSHLQWPRLASGFQETFFWCFQSTSHFRACNFNHLTSRRVRACTLRNILGSDQIRSAERESKLGYEDVDWEKLRSEGLLRKQKVSILNLYTERHSLRTEKKWPKKRRLTKCQLTFSCQQP